MRRDAMSREQEIDMRSSLAAGVIAGLALATAVRAQDAPAPAPADAATPTETAPAAAYDAETVLATVNGKDITLGHVIALRDQLPAQYQNLPDETLLTGLLDQLVDQEILAGTLSTEPANDPLAVRLQLDNDRRGALANLAAEAAVADAVSDEAVQAAYDKEIASFQPQPEFHAAHVLVDSEEKATALKAEIDGGKAFADVAKENSTDGSAANGGDLGWFGLGQMVPEFEEAVKGMTAGEVAGPIKTQIGYHLILLEETRESSPPALDAVRPQIENQIRQAALEAKLTELRDGATVERPDTGLPATAIRESGLLTN
jgi:peptidyl-prolyl cis-trans isomerase C